MNGIQLYPGIAGSPKIMARKDQILKFSSILLIVGGCLLLIGAIAGFLCGGFGFGLSHPFIHILANYKWTLWDAGFGLFGVGVIGFVFSHKEIKKFSEQCHHFLTKSNNGRQESQDDGILNKKLINQNRSYVAYSAGNEISIVTTTMVETATSEFTLHEGREQLEVPKEIYVIAYRKDNRPKILLYKDRWAFKNKEQTLKNQGLRNLNEKKEN